MTLNPFHRRIRRIKRNRNLSLSQMAFHFPVYAICAVKACLLHERSHKKYRAMPTNVYRRTTYHVICTEFIPNSNIIAPDEQRSLEYHSDCVAFQMTTKFCARTPLRTSNGSRPIVSPTLFTAKRFQRTCMVSLGIINTAHIRYIHIW